MAINRKAFLKTFGGVSLGLLVGQLSAGSFGQQSTSGALALVQHEEKHLQHFYAQLRDSSFLPSGKISAFGPASIVRRKTGFRSYHFEYIAQNGSRVVMTRKKGQLITKTLQGA